MDDADHKLLIELARAVILSDHFPGSNMRLKQLLVEATKAPQPAPVQHPNIATDDTKKS